MDSGPHYTDNDRIGIKLIPSLKIRYSRKNFTLPPLRYNFRPGNSSQQTHATICWTINLETNILTFFILKNNNIIKLEHNITQIEITQQFTMRNYNKKDVDVLYDKRNTRNKSRTSKSRIIAQNRTL